MNRKSLLVLYMYTFGAASVVTSFSVPLLMGDALMWLPRNLATELMVGSLYFALGVVMIINARSAIRNKTFIDFIILSSLLHAGIMVALADKPEHIWVDSLFIGLLGIIPLMLYPWRLNRFLKPGS